jgi:PAS domain S-box-containing protein
MKVKKESSTLKELPIFNALPGAAAVINQAGEIISTNSKWSVEGEKFYWFGEKLNGSNYYSHCEKVVKDGNDYALKIIFGLRSVLDREMPNFEITIPAGDESERLWLKISITPCDDKIKGALLLFENVSKNMIAFQALRESEEIYGQHFKHSLAGIILATPKGKIIDVNPAACSILGYTRQELLEGGRSLISDEKSEHNKEIYRIREEKSIYEGEKEYIHKNRSNVSVEISSVLYRNENGELRIINTFRDKTNEKQILQNLKEERRFTRTAINSIPGIFFVLNKEMKLVWWNSSFAETLDIEHSEVNGSNVLQYFPKKDQSRLTDAVIDAFKNGTAHVITELITKNNAARHYHLIANSFTSNGTNFLVGTGTDINELIESEKEKDKNYELISQLFESSHLGMVMLNRENRVMKVNDSFTDLFGFSKLETIGENISELITPQGESVEYNQICERVFSGESIKEEVLRGSKDGTSLNIIINTVPIWQDNEVVGAYVIYIDLTEQKQLESRIQQSLNEKEVLLQEVHHRVKNNLAIIAGLLDLQIMEEDDLIIEGKLNEVRSRIFAIAKIHETLYEKEDVVKIRFDHYIHTVMDALPQKGVSQLEDVEINLNTSPVTLNLNQAVPCGLAINELMNIIFSGDHSNARLKVGLRELDDEVEFSIESDLLNLEKLDLGKNSKSFHIMLIEIFLSQIHGTLEVKNGNSKRVFMRFKKLDIRGSSSFILNEKELISN